MCRALLKSGARIDIKNHNGHSVLVRCAIKGNLRIAKELMQYDRSYGGLLYEEDSSHGVKRPEWYAFNSHYDGNEGRLIGEYFQTLRAAPVSHAIGEVHKQDLAIHANEVIANAKLTVGIHRSIIELSVTEVLDLINEFDSKVGRSHVINTEEEGTRRTCLHVAAELKLSDRNNAIKMNHLIKYGGVYDMDGMRMTDFSHLLVKDNQNRTALDIAYLTATKGVKVEEISEVELSNKLQSNGFQSVLMEVCVGS
jgi:hypothetical protein